MVSNNKLMLGILQALDEKNIRVPEQLSVIGFDDYIWNRYFSPSLTAVAQSTHEMGQQAFDLLIRIINRQPDDKQAVKNIRLSTELRVRNSTASPD